MRRNLPRACKIRLSPHLWTVRALCGATRFFVCNRVDTKRCPEYIPPTGAPHCLGVMARLSKHLTCNSEPSFRSVVGGRNASTVFVVPGLRGWGLPVPGCLKSESEERETWTAESLRAASIDRSLLRSTGWPRREYRRSTFQGTSLAERSVYGPRQT